MASLNASRVAALKKVALLADLDESDLQILAAAAVPRRYGPGEMVFSEGDPCEGLYVVESGLVKLFKVSASGREQVLTLEGPGASMAETILPRLRRSMRVSSYLSARRISAGCAWSIRRWR